MTFIFKYSRLRAVHVAIFVSLMFMTTVLLTFIILTSGMYKSN